MAGLDSVGQHPLSLKVMRVSRPSLAAHWQPFFSSSPSLSAHSTASALSLQGASPLAGHPKTLRDLTHAGPLLTLPAAFGAIQLGETFACVLSVNNEAGVPVDAVRARVEMQTAANKNLLQDAVAGAPGSGAENQNGTLGANDSLELCVATEIKELGQHVLACTVTYRTPPGMRPATSGADNTDDPFMQSFRKFYKFMVTNPLSVKTKVHIPKSPTALLSRAERDKVFLEVHIQNLTQGPLWFEKIRLEPVDGWNVVDANLLQAEPDSESGKEKSIFSGNMAMMPPQDMRQYIYILTPKIMPRNTSVPVSPVPGTIIPLGRLDISWRSSMGEPGRLLTSVLSRRIPLPPPPSSGVAPASALPPYLQKSVMPGSPRAHTPSLHQQVQQQQRTSTPPPQRPGSPSTMKRATTPGPPARPQSPGLGAPPVPAIPGQIPSQRDIEVDLVLLEQPEGAAVRIEEPFSLRFSLAVSAMQPLNVPNLLGDLTRKSRVVTLAVQHISPAPVPTPEQAPTAATGPVANRTLKKRASTTLSFDTAGSTSGMHSPSSHAGSIDLLTPRRVVSPPPGSTGINPPASALSAGESLVASPTSVAARAVGNVTVGGLTERLRRVALSEALGIREGDSGEAFGDGDDMNGTVEVRLPPPYSASITKQAELNSVGKGSGRVQFTGTSAVLLPPIRLTSLSQTSVQSPGGRSAERGEGSVEFMLPFLPRTQGFARIGGLRVLLVKDQELEDHSEAERDNDEATLHPQGEIHSSDAQVLREWDVVAEVWVR